MKAGKTDLEAGTRVRITHVADDGSRDMVGLEGEITHPFANLRRGTELTCIAGLFVSEESARRRAFMGGAIGRMTVNLHKGDRFEVIGPAPGRGEGG